MKKKDGFERRTLAKKEIILRTARDLFFSQGPSETTIAEIAAKADVSQVSIYNYFESKDRLLEMIIREHLETSLRNAEAILEKDIPFAEKMEEFVATGHEIENEVEEEALRSFNWEDKRIQAVYQQFVTERQIPFLIRFIEIGKSEGAIQSDLSNDAIIAFLMGNMSIYRDKDFLKKGKRYLSSLSHLFFYGLIGK